MKKILLVDDEERMCQLLMLYLLPHGYSCNFVNNGEKAIEYMNTNTADFILMDVMMPGKDGWETVKEIRKFSGVPIIMVTARDREADIEKSTSCGANGHLSKPFDEKKLLFYVQKIIQENATMSKD